MHKELCAAIDSPIDGSTFDRYSIAVTYSAYPNPEPPYSSGTNTPINPKSPNFLKTSIGNV